MKPEKRNNLVVIFAIAVASAINVDAQEFRGFYSSSELKNNDAWSGPYRSGRSANKNSGYISSNSAPLNYHLNSSYPDKYPYQPFEENRSIYPAANLTINIFSEDYKPAPGVREYNSRDYSSKHNYYNRSYYPPNNNKISAGTKTIKINGNRFYEMNGDYYRADHLENINDVSYRTNEPQEKYNIVKGQETRNSVYLPASSEGGNSNYFNDGYNSGYNTYADARSTENNIFTLQKEQKALQEENNALKQKLNEQEAILDEQKKRLQIVSEYNVAKGQQEAQKDDFKETEAKINNASEANALNSNVNIGDTVSQIPKNSKIITIDGKKTYISPKNIYYQEQKNSKFIVVGMEKK